MLGEAALPGPESMPLGYAGLIAEYGLACPPPRRSLALAGVRGKTVVPTPGTEWLLLPRGSAIHPPATRIEHLGIALKHEGVDLRILCRLFASGIGAEMVAFVAGNPRGQYTRRAWFLYEWLTGERLPIEPPEGARYVPALDPAVYFTRKPVRSARHKVEDNMPGVPGFCPLVRRTGRLAGQRFARLKAEAGQLLAEADPAVLRRAVAFMLLNEGRGSFGIEGEAPPRTRLERWGHVIAAAGNTRLTIPELENLQRSLFDKGQRFVRTGLRQVGGFVGQRGPYDNALLPDHISARPQDLRSLMRALLDAYALLRTEGFEPVLTAALVGFGFVFIHPFEDGNGRLHRFLIQKALIDGQFNPPGVVLPISAAILDDLAGYRATLEDYSRPTLAAIEWDTTPDGNVEVTNDTAYLYSYFDATRQAEYLADRIEHTIQFAVPAELLYLHRFDDAKRRVAAVADMPDRLATLLIQFCIQNGGTVSARKRAEFFPGATDGDMADLEAAVRDSGIVPPPPTGTTPASPSHPEPAPPRSPSPPSVR